MRVTVRTLIDQLIHRHTHTQQAVSGDGSRGDCGLPLGRFPVGLQTPGRSRAAKTSTGGQGTVEPIRMCVSMCVCVCAYSVYQKDLLPRWQHEETGLIETAAVNCSLRP